MLMLTCIHLSLSIYIYREREIAREREREKEIDRGEVPARLQDQHRGGGAALRPEVRAPGAPGGDAPILIRILY